MQKNDKAAKWHRWRQDRLSIHPLAFDGAEEASQPMNEFAKIEGVTEPTATMRGHGPSRVSRPWAAVVPIMAVFTLAAMMLAAPGIAHASSYTAYGETGWNYTNKAYCCEDAVAIAQENSARSCELAGGYADFRRSSARGRCDWQTKRGDGRSVYRCSASASVNCR